ncbi:MAG: trypsin-like peptidase domain-containing protein [Porticoccaceae bacterium]
MPTLLKHCLLLCGFFLLLANTRLVVADTTVARQLFADNRSAILQIRIIDLTSGSKSAIGSGFPIDQHGLIATNYHVIELAASEPHQYRIEYLTEANQTGVLKLVDVDVINDLALVKADQVVSQPIALASIEPEVGVPVFALGNPLDLGLTVVPGTYNGINTTSYYPRVHFTGSLNSGMSGGPTLNQQGQVIGINVATAGNQISFLVPVGKLQKLVADYQSRGSAVTEVADYIGNQLQADQQQKMTQLLAADWQAIGLGQAQVLQQLPPFVKCWGGSNNASTKAQFLSAERSCRSEDNIYLNAGFETGTLEYQFFWLEADKLNSWQFYTVYENLFGDFAPGNRATEEDVSEFHCDHDFITSASQRQSKTVFCTRAYRDYPGLYDTVFLQGTADNSDKAFISHFTLAGVSRENSLRFARRFMEVSQWR